MENNEMSEELFSEIDAEELVNNNSIEIGEIIDDAFTKLEEELKSIGDNNG
jgi:hypothetical protein